MAKETKKSAAKQVAAEQKAPETKIETAIVDKTNPNIKGLSPDAKAQYLASVQAERAYMLNNTEKPSTIIIDGLTLLAQSTILDIAVNEIANGGSALGYIITANEKNYGIFQAMALENGVKLPDFKALPAPSKEDLMKAGLSGVNAQAKLLTVTTESVSTETIEQKKKENKVAASAKTIENPVEIENEEQLKASLTALLVKPIKEGVDRPDARIQRTIKFYRGYLTIQANKAEDKKTALAEVKAKSFTTMLNEISQIVGSCPFALKGTAYFLRKGAVETNSPIHSFCLYRRNAVPGADGTVDDQYLADIVKILITWSCNSTIADAKKSISDMERLIKKNEEANKTADKATVKINNAAIKQEKDMIDKHNAVIAEMNTIVESVINPSFDIVDSLIDNYKSDKTDSEPYKIAHRIVDGIVMTYYPEYKGKKIENETLLKNIQQYAGIIVNMFRDPLSQSVSYTKANIVEVVEEEKEEKVEEPEKN